MQTARSQRRDSSASNLRESTRSSNPSRMYQISGTCFGLRISAPMTCALAALVTSAEGPISSINSESRRAKARRHVAARNSRAAPGRAAVSPVVASASGQDNTHVFAPASSALFLNNPSPGTIRWNSYESRRRATSSSRLISAPPSPLIAHNTATLGNGTFHPVPCLPCWRYKNWPHFRLLQTFLQSSPVCGTRHPSEMRDRAYGLWVAWDCTRDVYLGTEKHLALDRKSTRLNSSHLGISYAVFCLK